MKLQRLEARTLSVFSFQGTKVWTVSKILFQPMDCQESFDENRLKCSQRGRFQDGVNLVGIKKRPKPDTVRSTAAKINLRFQTPTGSHRNQQISSKKHTIIPWHFTTNPFNLLLTSTANG